MQYLLLEAVSREGQMSRHTSIHSQLAQFGNLLLIAARFYFDAATAKPQSETEEAYEFVRLQLSRFLAD